jgi:hypothetical protein
MAARLEHCRDARRNVTHGLGHGSIGAVVAASPAVALVGSYELLMVIIRGAQTPAAAPGPHGDASVTAPLRARAQLIASSRYALSAPRYMLASRAQRLRDYLAAAAEMHGGNLAA